MTHPPLPKYHLPTILTWQRIDARHDRRWHTLADNDTRFDAPDLYFDRLRAAQERAMRGDD